MVRKKLFIFILTFVILITPYFYQVMNTPPGYTATGFFAGGADYATFITKMKWGMEGHWTYENRYTGEDTEPVPIYQFYLFLGHLAEWTGLSLPWVFHLTRSLLGAFTVIYLWQLIKKHVPVNPVVATILSILASGGFLEAGDCLFGTEFNKDYSDFFLQGRVWLAYLTYPHYCLELLGVLLLLNAYLSSRLWLAVPGGIFIALVHPFLLGLFCPVILLSSLIRKDFRAAVICCALASAVALPIIIPMYLAIQEHEWLRVWRDQTYRPTPHFIKFFLLGYGLTGIAGWYGFVKWMAKRDKKMVLWVIWLVLAVVLSYLAPFPNKREYAFFVSIPLGILAAPWIEKLTLWVMGNSTGVKRKVIQGVVILFCTWQCLAIYGDCIINSTNDKAQSGNYILPEYQTVFRIIDDTGVNQVVLTNYWLGNIIPAHTRNRPFIGHVSETLNFKEKKEKVEVFLDGRMSSQEMVTFLRKNNISWVLLDQNIAKAELLSSTLGPPIFQSRSLTAWQIRKNSR